MTNKNNYVCIIELLNFKQISLESGRDLLQIRVENIVNQVRKITNAIPDIYVNILGDRISFVMDSENNQFEKFIEMIMDYNKQALLFGLPHKAIIFKENAIGERENNFDLHVSREEFSAIEKLENLNLSGVVFEQSLYEEQSEILSKYTVLYENEIVLKLAKRPIAAIALQGMKNSISNGFNKIGINDFTTQFSKILQNTLKFVDIQNA